MKILVTFAVDAEFAPWRSRRSFVVEQRFGNSAQLYRAATDGLDIQVLLTGIGWDTARDGKILSEIFETRADICISSGLAGALKPSHRHGDVLVARGVTAAGNGKSVCTDSSLVAAAEKCGASAVELFITNGGIVSGAREKEALGALGDAVEMESYHILAAASGVHVPAVAVRAISDTVEENLPLDFTNVVDRHGHVRWGSMVREVGRHPQRIPALMRFGKRSRDAAAKLAEFLDAYVNVVAMSSTVESVAGGMAV